jgi:hypothetical protein
MASLPRKRNAGQIMPGEHGHIEHVEDKRIALLIAVLALALALIETGAKSAQTEAISRNVQSSDIWAFYQARVIRQTVVKTAMEQAELTRPTAAPAAQPVIDAQVKTWRDTTARWEDDPKGGDGRKQLAERAKTAEAEHEKAMSRYHLYEYGAALLQVAIVIASASIVTSVSLLGVGSVLLGVAGIALGVLGFAAPDLLHTVLATATQHG